MKRRYNMPFGAECRDESFWIPAITQIVQRTGAFE